VRTLEAAEVAVVGRVEEVVPHRGSQVCDCRERESERESILGFGLWSREGKGKG
jgi:hypothetical protein